MKWKAIILVVGLLLLGLILVGCGATPEPCPDCPDCPKTECPDCPATECPEAECPVAECPECPAAECPVAECPECPAAAEVAGGVPFAEMWAESGHADADAEAFRHWDEDDPKEVPASCAGCHSTPGYQDYLGADGSEMWVVDNPVPVGSTIECVACHNEATAMLDTVLFPSGITVTVEGPEARCMTCHQGRASKFTVDAGIEEAGLADMDTVSEDLGFTNIHYFAAAATQYGTLAKGGYEYEGKAYDAKAAHVDGFDTCVGCHSPHTLELRTEACSTCHSDSDPKDIRMPGSQVDYDGDGDVEEGIYYEIEGLQGMLMQAMQAYGNDVSGTPISYDTSAYPYFFIDGNGNGEVDEDEAVRDNGYNAWTGRLAKAAYNYQTSLKDPGAYAHGGKYIIELLYDSIDNLNEALSSPIDLSTAHRIDAGHFAGSEEAFRHWDADGAVSASCATCHSAAGLPFVLEHGVQIEQEISNGFMCSTCHSDPTTYTIHEVTEVEFPSGAVVDSGNPGSNLCMTCHQGRESTVSVNRSIGDAEDNAITEGLGFVNVHYFAAGATLFGGEVQGAYQFEGKEYIGRNAHVEPYSNCTQCHSVHMLQVETEECSVCHAGVEDVADIRMSSTDYDGDGDTAEGMSGEIETMVEALYAALQAYASDVVGTPIAYDALTYPYFLIDTNANGEVDGDEANRSNGYVTWTPALLRAAYNYQYAQKDPGAYAHNPKYVIQFLYDSIEHVGGDVSGMTRP